MGFPNVTLKDDSAEEFTLDAKNIKIDSENENEDNHEIKKNKLRQLSKPIKKKLAKTQILRSFKRNIVEVLL